MSGREDGSLICPTDDTVALFLGGALAGTEEAAFRKHVDECAACRDLLVEAGREMYETLVTTRVAPVEAPGRNVPPREPEGREAPGQEPAAPIAVGDVIGDKYRIDAFVGAGGMGTVYRGIHLALNRVVAIKMMHPEMMDREHSRRFAREARAAASLTSEHAVRIIDIDRTASGAPYIVMEHLEGRDLHEVLMSGGPLHWERAVRYVLEAADAIGEAHARGIIHRDLKPHNLFLTTADVVKVLDFGLAKTMPHSLARGDSADTKTTGLVGSPQYMAPEQIRAERTIDARTDVYALGATLYQLLTGTAPFLGLNLFVLCARILDERPAPLSRVRKEVPKPIEAVVLRCLEKLPAARYGSIEDLSFALRDAVAAVAEERAQQSGAAEDRRRPTTAALPSTELNPKTTMREEDLVTMHPAPDVTLSAPVRTPRMEPVASRQPPSTEAAPTPRIESNEPIPNTVKMPPVGE
jgi:serine/threonine-protein kinase